jgi:hypothetical protein
MNPSEPLNFNGINTNNFIEYFASSNFKFVSNPVQESSKNSISMNE